MVAYGMLQRRNGGLGEWPQWAGRAWRDRSAGAPGERIATSKIDRFRDRQRVVEINIRAYCRVDRCGLSWKRLG